MSTERTGAKAQTKRAHFYNGNVKTGDMLTYNKLAGCTEFNGCKGTCGGNCEGCWNPEDWEHSDCYCAKAYRQYGDKVINSHIVNTEAIRNNLWGTMRMLNEDLKRKRTIKPVRIHSAGEIEGVEEIKAWAWIAGENPNRPFYIYTKAYKYLDEYLTKNASTMPNNFFINVSIWHERGIRTYLQWKHLPQIRAFAYDDKKFDYEKNGLKLDGYCPAYKPDPKTGKVKLSHELTCDKCKICFQEKVKALGCLSH